MSGLVFGAIAPHGHLAIAEACSPAERGLGEQTQVAMAELGRRFVAARPDVTILCTPHHIHVEGAMAVVVAGALAGSLSDWTREQIELRCAVDRELAHGVLAALAGAGIPAVGVSYGGNDQASATAPMDWGTLIPLWFMGGRAEPQVPVVVIGPARELDPATQARAWAAHPAVTTCWAQSRMVWGVKSAIAWCRMNGGGTAATRGPALPPRTIEGSARAPYRRGRPWVISW